MLGMLCTAAIEVQGKYSFLSQVTRVLQHKVRILMLGTCRTTMIDIHCIPPVKLAEFFPICVILTICIQSTTTRYLDYVVGSWSFA